MDLFKISQNDGPYRRVVRSILPAFFVRATTAFGTIALNIVLARLLGARGFGLFMLSFAVLTGVSTLARCGMDNALLRFAGTAWSANNAAHFRGVCIQAISRVGFVTIILACLLYCSAQWTAYNIFSEPAMESLLKIMAIAMLPYSAMYIFSSLLKAVRRAAIASLFENGGISMAAAVLVLIAYVSDRSVSVVSAAWILCSVTIALALASCYLVLRESKNLVRQTQEIRKEPQLESVASTFILTSMAVFIIQWSSSLILGIFSSAEEVALFSAAQRTAFVITFILVVINNVMPPRIAALYSLGLLRELESLVAHSTVCMAVIALVPLAVLVFFPVEVLALFGQGFEAAAPHMMVLSIAQFINVCTGSVGFLLNMTGHEKIMRNLVLLTCVGMLSLSFILIPIIGIWGATISCALAIVAQNLIAVACVKTKLNVVTFPRLRSLVNFN